ncbi:hypothetical protein A3Q34_16265 [Colwellia sp. PAMC 20917]|uniref:cytochrome c3 family protein n=1 Tax=Colwellia sp. PAMC 20917 TaxID=1816218 RepID=UPI0008784933|nr:cytochrome c3 family protein [Colwellia sp. PAMC 20917]AOW78260.1 hypothetical protein A3Q34_16265 [Colwellia sp. PAMC 20917]
MKLLIRHLKKQGQGQTTEDVFVEGDTLLIGRGTNQHILLPDQRVALAHAKLTAYNDGCKISASTGKYVLFNGQMVKKCMVSVGDTIEISGHKITLLPGDKGCAFVVEVTLSTVKQEPLQNRYQVNFNDLNLHKRSWSWLLFSLIFILCLALPISGVLSPSWMETLRESSLPSDGQWLAGDLIKPHKFMGDDCSQCHVNAFEPTTNEACLSCHTTIKQHVAEINITADFSPLNQCTSCHKEHNSKEVLSDYSQQICVNCHVNISQDKRNNREYGSATDFEGHHPAFSVSMLKPIIANRKITSWQTERHLLNDNKITEKSNLKFPHKLHMDPKGIKSATGDVQLACNSCHEPETNGMAMKPITMEKNCQSCHQLTFDPEDPQRVVPHGSPADVVMMMREYYAFRFIYQNLNNDLDDSIVKAGDLFTVRKVRRPGRDERLRTEFEQSLNSQTIASIEKLTKQTVRTDALVWAESRANQAAIDIFERQACDVCHVVTKDESNDIPWQVEPVVLTKRWLPKADFTHDSHQTMVCLDCHNASSSELSSDVLIPDIENCRDCHGGVESENLIPNTCIDCHGFHKAKEHLFGQKNYNHEFNKTVEQMKNEH